MCTIALINPKDKMNFKGVNSLLSSSLNMLPLGLLYIATVLKKQGYEVEIFDFNAAAYGIEDETVNRLINYRPSLIGVSVTTTNYLNAKRVVAKLKENLSIPATIVWGGPHVTYLPEEPLQAGLADIVVRGEGEYIMLAIADLIKKGLKEQIKYIRGISFIQKGSLINNPPEISRIDDLDNLPFPDRSLVDLRDYQNPSTVVASRGCIGKCQFCASATWGELTYRTPENVIAEIMDIYNEYGFTQISFVDNVMVDKKERAIELLVGLIHTGLPLSLSAEINLVYIDEELINIFSRANLKSLQFGIESGNSEILRSIGKNILLPDVVKKVELCLSHGFKVVCSFIIGHPEDTKETVKDTINFAARLKKLGAQSVVSVLTPYPGSSVFRDREQLGVHIIDWNYENWGNPANPVIATKYLTKKDLGLLYREAIFKLNSF